MQTFSRRTGWDTAESPFAAAIRLAREDGHELCDLTVSNPTVCGFAYPSVLEALGNGRAMMYEAHSMGTIEARDAVCGYYRDNGAAVGPEQVVLTASTSEAYSYLFRLLCDAGDDVLVARPGYPLLDYLADLDDVTLRSYPLFQDFGWWIDFALLERAIGARTRAIVVVHPGNPTGHWTHAAERERLMELCARHGLALIVDEVFLDYPVGASADSFAVVDAGCLMFVLSGLSKVVALPQMKVGWMVVRGPGSGEALRRLEVIADTFLSVGTPAQWALSSWLAERRTIQEQIQLRTAHNLRCLQKAGAEFLPVEAGWSAVMRIPSHLGGAEQILDERGVIVHPGMFYGLGGSGRIVLSLIGGTSAFEKGVGLLLKNEPRG